MAQRNLNYYNNNSNQKCDSDQDNYCMVMDESSIVNY